MVFGMSDIAKWVTDSIIQQLEKGVVPWKKKWSTDCPKNIKGTEYKGVNRLILSMLGFESPYFLTFQQTNELGGHVKAGEHPVKVVFWKILNGIKEDPETSEITSKTFPFMRYYNVYNLTQVELPDDVLKKYTNINNVNNPIEEAERIISEYKDKPEIKFGGNQAYYLPAKDIIQCPDKNSFESSDYFYSTLFHEAVHSTGSKNRLDRIGVSGKVNFATETYSKEELIAELGSAFLCAKTGITSTVGDSASYINSWLKVLKDDRKMIISASSMAEKAMEYIIKGKEVVK